jgi:streptomycin 6-kinase
MADTLREAWRLPVDAVPPGEDRAVTLHDLVVDLDERLGRPTDRRVLRTALDHADALAGHDPATTVVLHGDAHPGNTLPVTAPRDGAPAGHVLVDPDGFRGDPAYDAGVVLRDWCSHLTGPDARRRLEGWCDLVAGRTGTDPARVWAWAYLERVSTGLYVTSFGAGRVGRPFLATAEHLLR